MQARVLLVLFFFPRGGSAQVTRAVASALPGCGWEPVIAAGSFRAPGELTSASTFFAGQRVTALEYVLPALPGFDTSTRGVEVFPFQPSYEDRSGAPDRAFPRVDDLAYERLVRAWSATLAAAGAASVAVAHLNHLTPAHEAAAHVAPHVPRVTQLHGTELALLREIEVGSRSEWPHARAWAERMHRWARQSACLVVHPGSEGEAADLLGIGRERLVAIPGGIDLDRFSPRPYGREERMRFWRRWLCEEPCGWDEGGRVGSIAYQPNEIAVLGERPVIVYAGRFTSVKRVPQLVRAYARARSRFNVRAPLVLIGGHPGEWEGEHPATVIRDENVEDVFLAGWRPQEELADAFNAADLFVLPSERESFGLVAAEAMACGLPVITTATGGPRQFVRDGSNGWLSSSGDLTELARLLAEAVNDRAERRKRGANAARDAQRFSWTRTTHALADIYDSVIADQDATRGIANP